MSEIPRDELWAAIDDTRERLLAIFEPACPTEAFLVALLEEVCRAVEQPDSVPHPELADPDAFWEATVRPQTRLLRVSVAEIVAALEERVIGAMADVEVELNAMVDEAVARAGVNVAVTRSELARALEARCLELHDRMDAVLDIRPPRAALERARRAATDAVRARATADVASLEAAYLRDAGGDDEHQRFAREQWVETFPDRVAHREAMLVAMVPWRHIELVLVGYERAVAEADRLLEQTTARLQSPLRAIRDLLLEEYDAALGLRR